jgi:hypothetical protein
VATVAAGNASDGVKVTVTIVHVYVGEKKLVGSTFTDVYITEDLRGKSASIPFTNDEEGIWTIAQSPNGISPYFDERMPFSHRSRKSDNRRHEQIITLAEAIEKTEQSKPDDRIPLLLELILDKTPEVSAWAVHTLGNSQKAAAQEYFEKLSKQIPPNLPIASQVALDEVLSKNKEYEWMKSKVRSALLESWVKGKTDEYHMTLILRRFDMADQLGELSNRSAIALTRMAAENKEWTRDFRIYAIRQVGRIADRGVDDESTYIWLFEQIQKNTDGEFRRAAAGTLARFIAIYPARLKAIEKHLEAETDKDVIRSLHDAVKKGQDRK